MSFPLELLNTIVEGGYNYFSAYASNSYNLAVQNASALRAFEAAYEPITLNFNPTNVTGEFAAPSKPTRTIGSLVLPPEPSDLQFQQPSLDTALAGQSPPVPNFNTTPYRKPGGEPGALTAIPPDALPEFAPITFPDRPLFQLPPVPTLESLKLPTPPTIQIPAFTATAPEINFPIPTESFSFLETQYSSALKDAIEAKITSGMQGGTGLSAAIEQALFDRARSQEEANAQRAIQEVNEEFATRGFSEPNGVLAQRLLQVRQNNQNQSNQLRRQIEIENKQIEIEQLRFFVAQGLALEQLMLNAHLQQEERRFQAARYAFEATLQVFNSRVSLFNAQVQAYGVAAQVFRDRVQAALVEAEIFRTQVEAQRVIGELNKTLIDQYEAQIRGVLALVEVYRTDVQVTSARIEANRNLIEGYRARVQAYGERVRAYQIEWEGYATRVRAELGTIEAQDVQGRVYASQVQAWGVKWNAALGKLDADTRIELAKAQKYDADIKKHAALLDAQRSKIASEAQALAAEASVYSAGGQIAAAQSAAGDRTLQIAIEQNRSQAELHLKNAEVNTRALIEASAQRLEALRTLSNNAVQLAASSMSAISVGGSVTGSTGFSYGQEFNYSGDIQDPANPNF